MGNYQQQHANDKEIAAMTIKLHLGCSNMYPGPLDGWENLDIKKWNEKIVLHDLRKPLSYDTGTVSACFSCHTLEHLNRSDGSRLLAECFRVMKSGSPIRVIVPDFLGIIDLYVSPNTLYFIAKKMPHPAKKWGTRESWLLEMLYPQDTDGGCQHKYMYTVKGLYLAMVNAGFKNVNSEA
ncbi:MAG: methyltransferase domain-containing protein, partial [bacterium]